jgi:hypothetical protein
MTEYELSQRDLDMMTPYERKIYEQRKKKNKPENHVYTKKNENDDNPFAETLGDIVEVGLDALSNHSPKATGSSLGSFFEAAGDFISNALEVIGDALSDIDFGDMDFSDRTTPSRKAGAWQKRRLM